MAPQPQKPNFTLLNPTKGKSLAICMEIADTEMERMRGLMFRKKIVPILFVFGYEGIFPIHSYFVVDIFDAIYVAKDGTVNEIYRRIPPSTALVKPKKNSTYLLELPCDMTDRLKIEEGDKLKWKNIDSGKKKRKS